jgi:iron complex transport system ATP-binding protein
MTGPHSTGAAHGSESAIQTATATAPANPTLLQARDVQVTIRGQRIVHHADLTLAGGEVVALVGPNGAGKSTVARAVAGLQKHSAGTITWGGEPVEKLHGRKLARLRAFVPQQAPVPAGITVGEAIALGRAPHIGPLRRPTHHDRAAVEHSLERVGVAPMRDRMLNTLSGGELQRVRVAVALAQESPCVILDEPTSNLDLGAAAAFGRLLRSLTQSGLAVLVVLHDLALAAAVADSVVVLHQGRTVASGPAAEVITRERLAEIWQVDASLTTTGAHTALSVDWLGSHSHALSELGAAAPPPAPTTPSDATVHSLEHS